MFFKTISRICFICVLMAFLGCNAPQREVYQDSDHKDRIFIGPGPFDFVEIRCVTNISINGKIFNDYCDDSPINNIINMGHSSWLIKKSHSVWNFYRAVPLSDSILSLLSHD